MVVSSLDMARVRRLVCATTGLALLWLIEPVRNIQASLPEGVASNYLVLFAAFLVGFATAVVAAPSFRAVFLSLRASVSICVSAVVLWACVLFVPNIGDLEVLTASLGILCVMSLALCHLHLFLRWMQVLRDVYNETPRAAMLCVAGSELVFLVISLLFEYTIHEPAVVTVACPLLSLACLAGVGETDVRTQAQPSIKARFSHSSSLFIVSLVVLFLAGTFAADIIVQLASEDLGYELWRLHLISAPSLLLITVFTWFAKDIKSWTYVVVLFAALSLSVGLLLFGLSQSNDFSLCLGVVVACRAVFVLALMAGILSYQGHPSSFETTCVMAYTAPFAMTMLFEGVILPVLIEPLAGETASYVSSAALVIAIVLLIAQLAALGALGYRGIRLAATPAGPVDKADPLETLMANKGLTEREMQAARYLLKGYSIKMIAEAQGLSANTIQTHAKHLYQKLGIHSRDELVNLVEASRS